MGQMAIGIGRRELMAALGGVAVAWPLPARAQQAKVPRLGFLGPASPTGFQVEALRAGLRDFGYVEGRNLAIEYRFADGQYDRLPALANELVRLNVDVIVTHSTPGTQAAKAATSTIPIVRRLLAMLLHSASYPISPGLAVMSPDRLFSIPN
jgi:putative ABC transport system substrate-binding protein